MSMVTNIQHLFPADPIQEVPESLLKLRSYLGQIIRVATATSDAAAIASGLRCQKRIHRKRCAGFLLVGLQEVPGPFIYWVCDQCRDEGRIEGYVKSPYDLNQFENHLGGEEGDQRLSVEFTPDEYEAWISGDLVPYDPDSERLIYSARFYEDVVEIDAMESDLDILCDAVAADANHEKSKKRQKLMDSVFRKISDIPGCGVESAYPKLRIRLFLFDKSTVDDDLRIRRLWQQPLAPTDCGALYKCGAIGFMADGPFMW